MSTRRNDDEFVGSFDKGLRVLRAFDGDHPTMTLSEVARRTDLTRSAARRFLLTLVSLGYATVSDGRFALTARVLALGHAYLRALRLPEIVTPFLRQVSVSLEESSSAAVLDDLDIVYVARVQTRRIMSADLGVGARLPAIFTSMGRVLLANLPRPQRDDVLDRSTFVEHTRRTVTSKAKLRTVLDEVRERDFSLVDQELEDGLRSIAVPIRDRHGTVLAAINVSAQANRVTLDAMRTTFLGALRDAAAAVRDVLPT